ncbi:MAG: hypothetical protein J6R04_03435 [Clostridia bacterium]|nr:hypothetical protein [Clostridia bacterium]
MERRRYGRVLLLALAVTVLVACSPQTPPPTKATREVSVERLCETMHLTERMAEDVLALLGALGLDGEVMYAYPLADEDGNEYHRVWIGEDTVDVEISPYGAVTSVRRSGIAVWGVSEETRPETPSAVTVPLGIVDVTDRVVQGDTARIELTAQVGVEYRIEVHYKSGISTAKGLEARMPYPNGRLVWEWKVNSRVTPGDYRIRVVRVDDESDAVETLLSVVADE